MASLWKAKDVGISTMLHNFDGANAFGGTDRDMTERHLIPLGRPRDRPFHAAFIHNVSMHLDT